MMNLFRQSETMLAVRLRAQNLMRSRLVRAGIAPLTRATVFLISRFSFRRKNQLLQNAETELLPALADLKCASEQLEKDFLDTFESLQELKQQGQRFLNDSEKLVKLAVGQAQGGQFILNGTQVVETPLAFLESCLGGAENLLAQLQRDHQSIEQLMNSESDLRRIMEPLKFVQTLFKIESAPLGEEAQIMFTGLTHEIEQLHQQVRELFDTKFRELAQVQNILDHVGTTLTAQMANLQKFIAEEKGQIQDSLVRLAEELSSNQQRETRIRALSKKLFAEINEVIVGLQFQDIINQKLQHIEAAVQKIIEHQGTDDDTLQFLAQACQLQARQLQAIRKDLAAAETKIKTGINNLINHLSEADTDCLSLSEFNRLTVSADGMVQVLLGLIESVRKNVDDMVNGTAVIHQHLLPIHGMATTLTGVVRNFSFRIHLIGLNAQVQAAQFSRGAGLEVLSAHTSLISQQTNGVSEAIATHLDQLATGLIASVKAFDELHSQALAQQSKLAQEGANTEAALHKLRDDALLSLQEVGDMLGSINQHTHDALAAIHYGDTADHTLATLQQKLETLGQNAIENLGHRRSDSNHLIEHFQQDYTMASERQVYNQVVQGKTTRTPATPESAAAFVADLEFFDEAATVNSQSETSSLATTPTTSTPTTSSDCTIPAESSPSKPESGTANPKIADNLEFF